MIIPLTQSEAGAMLEIRRRRQKLPIYRLSAQLHISPNAYRQIVTGQREPTEPVLQFLNVQRSPKHGYQMRIR